MKLPTALERWSGPLALLHPEVAFGIGPWLGPLASLFGRLTRPESDQRGAPDGLAGVGRRGPYERLLASEWLLADELPDEFLRRATSGEHLFHELAFERASAERALVVLFDTGPWQLGAPRLAHMALLMVLAERAASMGAELRFASLQADELSALSIPSMRALLDARTARPARPADVERWRERLAAADLGEAECWLVGDGRPEHARMRNVRVREADEALEVHVGARRAELALLADALAARILRDPFPALARRRRLDTGEGYDPTILLSPDGRRLLFRPGDDVVALHVPTSAHEPTGSDKRAPARPGEPVIAAALLRRQLLWLGKGAGFMFLRDGGGLSVPIDGGDGIFTGRDGTQLCELYIDSAVAQGGVHAVCRAWLRDAESNLWRIDVEPGGRGVARCVASELEAFVQLKHDEIAFATFVDRRELRVASSRRGVQQYPRDDASGIRLGVAPGDVPVRALALPREWRVHIGAAEPRYLPLPPHGCGVLGVFAHGADPRLVVVDRQRRVVGLWNGMLREMVRLDRAAVALRWAPRCARLAYRTDGGDIGVYDAVREELVLRAEIAGTART